MSDDDEPLLPRPSRVPDKCGNLHLDPKQFVYEPAPTTSDPRRKRAKCAGCGKFLGYQPGKGK